MKNIFRHYENLTSTQRIALAVEAMARGDMQEMDRLDDTCPRKSYYGIDRLYTHGLSELHALALLYETEVLSRLVRVTAIQGVLIHLSRADSDEDDLRFDDYVEKMDILRAEIRGWNGAWEAFCEAIGLDCTMVLRAFGVAWPRCDQGGGRQDVGLLDRRERETKESARAALIEIFKSTQSH